jgi:hypothetical protein
MFGRGFLNDILPQDIGLSSEPFSFSLKEVSTQTMAAVQEFEHANFRVGPIGPNCAPSDILTTVTLMFMVT